MSSDEILADCFPAVWRVAHALAGSDRAGRSIVQTIVRQSLAAMPTRRPETPPIQWFYHHTVLAARTGAVSVPDPMYDPLVEHADSAYPAYVAFICALRHLPPQQREAFLLHFGEGLDDRTLGIAMDCSMGAAQKHLAAASAAMDTICHENMGPMLGALATAYQALTPEQVTIGPQIAAQISRAKARRMLRLAFRILRWLILLGLLAGGTWYFRATLLRWYELARSMDRPAETQPNAGP